MRELMSLLPAAILSRYLPADPETENLIDGAALGRMKPSAHLVNVARGRVVERRR